MISAWHITWRIGKLSVLSVYNHYVPLSMAADRKSWRTGDYCRLCLETDGYRPISNTSQFREQGGGHVFVR